MKTENLKAARKKCNMTQKEVADFIGVGQSTYKNYECGLREPNCDTIIQLADLFHVTTDYLLGRISDNTNPLDRLNLLPEDRTFISAYLELDVKERESLLAILRKLLQMKKAEIKTKETTV